MVPSVPGSPSVGVPAQLPQADGTAAPDGLRIELLGGVRITRGGRPLAAKVNERLLVYLLLERGRPVSREIVASALWPESGDAQALTNLRRELHNLRRTLAGNDARLVVTRRTIEWAVRAGGPGSDLDLDLDRFEADAAAGRAGDLLALERATGAYRGDLAPTVYDEWASLPREQLRSEYRATLARLLDELEARREYRRALDVARRLVAFDPLDEEGYRAQMRLAMLLGDRSTGLRAYHACVAALRRELDVEPEPETRAAYERLLAAGTAAASAAGPTVVTARRDAPAAADGDRERAVTSSPLVGRTAELATLTDAMNGRSANGRLLVVRGEPGIGKTRLLEEVARRWSASGARAATTRSYAAEGSLAYAPVVAWLRSPAVRGGLAGLEPVWLAELARLLPELLDADPELAAPTPMTEGWQRLRLFEALLRAVRAVPGRLLLVLDDAHWADPDTLEWLHFLVRAEPPPDVVVAMGIRVEEERGNQPLLALLDSLDALRALRTVDLAPLGEDDAARLASMVTGTPLDAAARARLHRETGGNPLFVLEVGRSGLAADAASGADPPGSVAGRFDAGALAIPPRMRAVIAGRLERLPPETRQLVDVAALVGRSFDIELLAEAADTDESAVTHGVDELWRRQIVREGAVGDYDFSHDRIRDVAADLVAPGHRRFLHRRIARAIERLAHGDLDSVAGRLAAHYEAAGMAVEAADFHERAANLAARLSANRDAIHHLSRAITLVAALPPGADRDRRELGLRLAIAAPLNGTVGYASPALQASLERGLELAELVGDRDGAILALNGLFHVHFVRGSTRRALEIAEAALARTGDDPRYLSIGHLAVGGTLSALGELERSVTGFERSFATFDPAVSRPSTFGLDAFVFARAWGAHVLWLRGREDDARAAAEAAVERAARLDHPFLQALAHAYSAVRAAMAGDADLLRGHATAAIGLCERYGFPYYGEWGSILLAWADRDHADGAPRIEAALAALRRIDAHSRRPYYLGLLADAHEAMGRRGAAAAVLDAARATAVANEDRWWLPELLRKAGTWKPGPVGAAIVEAALDEALAQRSYLLAARAAADLVRRDPSRRRLLTSRIAAIEDGHQDLPADAAIARWLAADDRA